MRPLFMSRRVLRRNCEAAGRRKGEIKHRGKMEAEISSEWKRSPEPSPHASRNLVDISRLVQSV